MVDNLGAWIAFVSMLAAAGGMLFATLGMRVEGAPQDVTRLTSRVALVEAQIAAIREDSRDVKSNLESQRYLLCYLIGKQEPSAIGAIASCKDAKAP